MTRIYYDAENKIFVKLFYGWLATSDKTQNTLDFCQENKRFHSDHLNPPKTQPGFKWAFSDGKQMPYGGNYNMDKHEKGLAYCEQKNIQFNLQSPMLLRGNIAIFL